MSNSQSRSLRGRPGDDAGDFAAVYEEQLVRVYGFIGYRVGSAAEAEDLTQVVFEKALRAWDRFDPARSAVSTWLISIATNVLIDHFRRRRESLLDDEALQRLADESGHETVGSQLSTELERALAALGPRERTVVALRFGAELSGSETAELLGISSDNAHQIASRALKKLRAELGVPSDRRGQRSLAEDAQ